MQNVCYFWSKPSDSEKLADPGSKIINRATKDLQNQIFQYQKSVESFYFKKTPCLKGMINVS
jgi:hypothetical protein